MLTGSLKAVVNGCTYQYTRFEGRSTVNPGLVVEGTGSGTATRASSRRSRCEPEHVLTFRTVLTSGANPVFASVYFPSEWNLEGH